MEFSLFGERLEACYRAKGYDAASFAEALGISEKRLIAYLKDPSEMKLSYLREIRELLDVSIDYLAGRKDNPPDYLKESEFSESSQRGI